jgi:peptide/nickel transport system permease protein
VRVGLWAFVFRRFLVAIPTLLGVTLVTFIVSHIVPGDPLTVILKNRAQANPEIIAAYRERYGLDRSLPEQYLVYVKGLLQGDLGDSFVTRRPVLDDLAQYLPATIELAVVAMLIATVVGLPLGAIAAIHRGRVADHLSRFITMAGASIPAFWLGLVVLFIFYYKLQWLPGPGRIDTDLFEPARVTGMILVDSVFASDWPVFASALRHLVLPACVLAAYPLAIIARLARSSLLDVLNMDYVRTARAKGLQERRVLRGHALRNALIPTVTAAGLAFGYLLAGAVTVEIVFSWPGIGRYAVTAATTLDYPAILGFTLVVAIMFIIVNLLVDLTYALLDPRIRIG